MRSANATLGDQAIYDKGFDAEDDDTRRDQQISLSERSFA